MKRVIEVRNLSKKYILGENTESYGNLREAVTQAVLKRWRGLRSTADNGQPPPVDIAFWALKHVSLDVDRRR